MLGLEEINKIIDNFHNEERNEIIRYYIKYGNEIIENPETISKKKILLFQDMLKYVNDEEKSDMINRIMELKTIQTRALILDLISSDYSLDRKYFSKPEKWIKVIIEDIYETFSVGNKENLFNAFKTKQDIINEASSNYELLNIYIEKLSNEMKDIFCSCEKFNSSGNQLLLNIILYKEALKDHVLYNFDELINSIIKRFNKGKNLELNKIYKIYDEYVKTIK